MAQLNGAMRWGANFTALSAALHLLALPVSGFSAEAMPLLPFAMVYAAFAYGLYRGWRWVGYITFLVLLIGISLALSRIWAYGDVPGWTFASIAAANVLAVVCLLGALWRAPEVAP